MSLPGAIVSLVIVLFITIFTAIFLSGGKDNNSGSSIASPDEEYVVDEKSIAGTTVIRTKLGTYVTAVDYVNMDGEYVGTDGNIYRIKK